MDLQMDDNPYFKGIRPSDSEEFYRLAEIFKEQVFELSQRTKNGLIEYYVAYMMNDAIESILIFENANVVGKCIEDSKEIIIGDISWDSDKNKYLLIVKQGLDNTYTVWFDRLKMECSTYQYHNIGHYWVEDEEYLRQINYRIGLIKDKYTSFGNMYCNKAELELLKLASFGPLQAYVYIWWDESKSYPSSEEGILAFMQLARESEDKKMVRMLEKYMKRRSDYRQRKITKALCQKEHYKVVELLKKRIDEASEVYANRKFGELQDELLEKCRRYVYDMCIERWQSLNVEILEEQPFTQWKKPFAVKFYFNKNIVQGKRIEQERCEVVLTDTGNFDKDYDRFVKLVDNVNL